MRALAPPRSLAYGLAVLAAAATLLGFPDVAAVAHSQHPAPPKPSRPPGAVDATRALLARGVWRLRFDDEFNGGRLDLHRWQPNWLGADAAQTTRSDNS